MNGPARLVVFFAIGFSAAGAAYAQPIAQPVPAPLVTAETEHWYQTGEPLPYAGNIYYRAGGPLYFNGSEMVRTGFYKGVPLYSRSTVEPVSTVFVPLTGGFVQPYERRTGDMAGSSAPSFPVVFLIDTARGLVTPFPVLQAAVPPMVASPIAVDDPVLPRLNPDPVATATARPQSVGTAGRVAGTHVLASKPAPLRPQAANGVFIEFDGARWFSSGPATHFDDRVFTRVGDLRGLPVYTARGRGATVFVAVAEGLDLVAPYSKRSR